MLALPLVHEAVAEGVVDAPASASVNELDLLLTGYKKISDPPKPLNG